MECVCAKCEALGSIPNAKNDYLLLSYAALAVWYLGCLLERRLLSITFWIRFHFLEGVRICSAGQSASQPAS